MDSLPFVSVLIPVHNGEDVLPRCLDSIFSQSQSNFEVVVVDNNSSDKTPVILEEYKKVFPNLRIIFEQTRGRGAARLAGEKACLGNIIMMTDCDCVVPARWIEKMIAPIISEGFDVVQGFESSQENDFWSRYYQAFSQKKWESFDGEFYPGYLDTKNLAITRSSLGRVGFSSPHYKCGEDTELSIRLYFSKAKFKFLEDVSVIHHHPETFVQVFTKQIERGRWSYILNRDLEGYASLLKFRRASSHTVSSFFKIKELLMSFYNEGFGMGFYLLTSGLAWRIGVLVGLLTYKSGKKGLIRR